MAKKKTINVIIIGSKNFDDYVYFEEKLYKVLEKYFKEEYEIIIREQEMVQVDTYAIRFANENNCKLERYKIQWDKYGKSAAYVNIKPMVWGYNGSTPSDILICFYKKRDKKADRKITSMIIDEYNSMLFFGELGFLSPQIYIFTKTK